MYVQTNRRTQLPIVDLFVSHLGQRPGDDLKTGQFTIKATDS